MTEPTRAQSGSQAVRKNGEFRRYRQGLAIAYLVVAGLGVAVLVGSVVRGLFFPSEVSAASPTALAECERDLTQAIERIRAQIPVQWAQTLQHQKQKKSKQTPIGQRHAHAQLVARCSRVEDSPAGRAVKEAAEALGDLDQGLRQLSQQFESDVAAHLVRADTALIRTRALLGQQVKSQ